MPTKEFPGMYEVSNFGRVKSIIRTIYKLDRWGNMIEIEYPSNILSQRITGKLEYFAVMVSINKQRKNCSVHRLVANAFIPNPFNYEFVNHKDGNKLNNNLNNLEWCSRSQNIMHAIRMGLKRTGSKNPKTKISQNQSNIITSKYIPFKYTRQMLAKEFNVSLQTIQNVLSKRHWSSSQVKEYSLNPFKN